MLLEISLEENLSANIQKFQIGSFLIVSHKVKLVESLESRIMNINYNTEEGRSL